MKTDVESLFESPVGCREAQGIIDCVSRFDYTMRQEAVVRYSFAIPCSEAIRALVALSPLVEVGAGSGYWSGLVGQAGGDIVATDIGKQSAYSKFWSSSKVVQMSAVDAVFAYPNRNVFVCWPSYDEDWAAEMALKIREGRKLIVIGEGHGGCTANGRFFDVMDEKFDEVSRLRIPQWEGIHDDMTIYERRKGV